MRLQRTRTRVHKGVAYYKWQVTIPSEVIEALGWEPGDEVAASAEDGALVVRKATDA